MTTRTTIGNLGTPSCNKQTGKPVKLIKVQKKDSTGAFNKIPFGTTIDDSYVSGLVQNIDTSVRWYPSPLFKTFTSPKEDTVYKTYGDGEKLKIRDGVRSYTGEFVQLGAEFLCNLNTIDCVNEAFYLVTDTNSIQGYSKDDSGDVYPIPVTELATVLNYATDDDIENVSFTIEIPNTVTDCSLETLFNAEANLLEVEGLVQLQVKAGTPTASGYSLTISGYGNAYPYLDATDLAGYDETADATIAVASISQTTATSGIYVVTFTSPTATNVVRLDETAVLTAKGFSFNSVSETIA